MVRSRTSAPTRRAALALLLALVVPCAPLARGAAAACEVCPRACPMHGATRSDGRGCHHTTAPPSSRHCHRDPLGVRTSGAPGARSQSDHDGWKRPGCGTRRPLPVAWIAEAVLPPPVPRMQLPVHGDAALWAGCLDVRAADPPESPPPIVRL